MLEEITLVLDNMFECRTIETCTKKDKNVVYTTPGSSIDHFNNWEEKTFTGKTSKVLFICGDFNIDLLNSNNHKSTEDFINTKQSLTLFPKMSRPAELQPPGPV